MKMRWTLVVVFVLASALGFAFESAGPIGKQIWPMQTGMPEPEGTNLVLLMIMGAIEAIAFGLGAVFLIVAYPLAKARMAGSAAMSWLSYISIAWILMNWVPHTALHISHGNITKPADFGGLVAIEYGFHLTLILAGCVLALGTVRYMRGGVPAPAGARSTARAA